MWWLKGRNTEIFVAYTERCLQAWTNSPNLHTFFLRYSSLQPRGLCSCKTKPNRKPRKMFSESWFRCWLLTVSGNVLKEPTRSVRYKRILNTGSRGKIEAEIVFFDELSTLNRLSNENFRPWPSDDKIVFVIYSRRICTNGNNLFLHRRGE